MEFRDLTAMEFRDLTPRDIDVRIATCGDKGVSLLLYKDARCDMNILDETVGCGNWQREHYECKGNLFCRVGIKCGDEWVFKSDCGTESYTEAQKGEASDSFKRACFNWGIGRELYTSPFIFVKWGSATKKDKNGKPTCYDKFKVSSIEIENKRIKSLSIFNQSTNKIVYEWRDTTPDCFMEKCHIDTIKGYCKDFNTSLEKVCEKYNIKTISEMSYEQFIDCCKGFEGAK